MASQGQSDVLVMSCDVVTTIPLHLLTDHHCCHASTLTALLVTPPKPTEEQTKKGRHPIGQCLTPPASIAHQVLSPQSETW